MKKVMLTIGLLIAVSICSQSAMAASAKCEIVKVEGDSMTVECKKMPKGFVQGETVKIKTKKKATVEGC